MKNFVNAFLLILSLAVVGCQQKEDGAEPVQVIGKWQLTHIEGTNMIADAPPGPPIALLYQETIEFKAGNTFIRTRSNGYVATGTYTLYHNTDDDKGIRVQFTNPDLNYHELPGTPVRQEFSGYNGLLALRFLKSGALMEDHRAYDGYNFFYEKVKTNN
ncbi:hypothetical protein [Adhaeribacter pallidiroseus]|uniref:Lipocalin-like domain-containing protein n=1 Tax=Adhaeribacter pallidiroseus TaxID=2072847 RepID=A0A369QJL6_9BACT|nr:hypothetical protein [Adhaeribacter pallidiroseus]RDC64582.1 hypothetical protein AHMF7616_03198 [Adhaeribacter pallidiroseus]